MTSFIIWSADPKIFSFLPIQWYGLLFAMGFLVSQQVMHYIYRKEGKPAADVDTITIFLIISAIVGGRLGHLFFYEPDILLERPLEVFLPVRFTPEFEFTGIQGLSSHGAAIGILTALWLFSRYDITFKGLRLKVEKIKRKGQTYLQVLDRVVIVVALTGCMIRMGNFINSEIVGIPTKNSCGVVFAGSVEKIFTGTDSPVEAVKFEKRSAESLDGYEPITMQVTFKAGDYQRSGLAQYIESSLKHNLTSYPYITANIYQPPTATFDYTLEKKGSVFTANIDTYGIVRHPAQLYESVSSFLIFLFLFAIWRIKKQDTAKGRIFGLFLVILFGLRFCYEFIKENQVDFEEDMALNMGQWLSIPLIMTGIVILVKSMSTK